MGGTFRLKESNEPIQIVMSYNDNPGNPSAAKGKWYKYQEQEGGKCYGMCQEKDLGPRIPDEDHKDSWGPEWLQSYKRGTGTYKD